jgi:hypothetical protein
MQTNRTIRHDAIAPLCLFVAALVPWLFVFWWHHAATDLFVGICAAGLLAVGGSALSHMNIRPSRHISAHIPIRTVRGRVCHPA